MSENEIPSPAARGASSASDPRPRIIALLGRKDEPTDALRDHCAHLVAPLASHGLRFELAELRWDLCGWKKALLQLAQRRRQWRGAWVHLHYTGLAWSRRGFPLYLPAVIRSLHRENIR